LRVLHVSHEGLPDVRVEKEVISLTKVGVKCYFAGSYVQTSSFGYNVFEKTYNLPFNRMANIGLQPWWYKLRKAFSKVLAECKPDLIHAHNVIAARLSMEFNIPFIYDDHEYWSKSSWSRMGIKPSHIYRSIVWRRWEREVLREATAVITVSDEIAEEHRLFNRCVWVVPNVPLWNEVKDIMRFDNVRKRLSSVYVGSLSRPQPPFRDVKGFLELFLKNNIGDLTVIGDKRLRTRPPIYSLGFLRHDTMMKELTKHHVGIIPWKRHPFHKYSNPNKAYEYAHAGLVVIVPDDLKPVIRVLHPFCETFKDYDELVSLLKYYMSNIGEAIEKGIKTMHLVRKTFIWEKFEERLFKIYDIAS